MIIGRVAAVHMKTSAYTTYYQQNRFERMWKKRKKKDKSKKFGLFEAYLSIW